MYEITVRFASQWKQKSPNLSDSNQTHPSDNSLSLGRTSLKHSYLYPHGLYLTETIPEPLVTISVYVNGTVQKNIFKRMQN